MRAMRAAGRVVTRAERAGGRVPNMPHARTPHLSSHARRSTLSAPGQDQLLRSGVGCELIWPAERARGLRSMARGLLHGIVAVTASAHSPVPPLLTVVPPPPLPPVPDDGGFSPLPAPRPPLTELGRALPSSQHDGRQLAHSTTIVGSGSIVGSVTSATVLDYVRATRPCALTSDAAPRSHAPRACSPTCTAPHALSRSRVTCCARSL